jgi:hypothetical protein
MMGARSERQRLVRSDPHVGTRSLISLLAAASAVAAGAVVTGHPSAFGIPSLPPTAIVAGAVFVAALPLMLYNWRAAAAVFLAWLLIEDLFRKLAGNDLSFYFAKDILYAVLLTAVVTDPTFRATWRTATGNARWWLYALMGWAVVMSVPTALQDWRLPLVGLRLDFLYVPLIVLGYQMARELGTLRRWLVGLSLLGGAASLIGVVQAFIGPSFLAPSVPTPGLRYLVLIRGLPESGDVYRPTGTFVEPGRFASMALVTVAIGLAATLVCRGRMRVWALAAAMCAVGAAWVSGGRATFLAGLGLVAIAALGTRPARDRGFPGKASATVGIALASIVLLATFSPALFQSRLAWYQATLDPRSPDNEWSFRWNAYATDTVRGIGLGGLVGMGTGQESLGKQYLYGGPERTQAGLYQVEAGYGTVAIEWGIVGLALWIGWSVAWVRRQWRAVRASRGSSVASVGIVLLGWMLFSLIFGFFGGKAAFQNYFTNAYFWLLSGVIFALPLAAREQDGSVRASA